MSGETCNKCGGFIVAPAAWYSTQPPKMCSCCPICKSKTHGCGH
jgi:hypothetical protein